RDEILTSVGSRPCVCHRKNSFAIMRQRSNFIHESVTRTAGSIAHRITALNHEFLDDTMEFESVVKWLSLQRIRHKFIVSFGKCDEIRDSDRRHLVVQEASNVAFRSFDTRVNSVRQMTVLVIARNNQQGNKNNDKI